MNKRKDYLFIVQILIIILALLFGFIGIYFKASYIYDFCKGDILCWLVLGG